MNSDIRLPRTPATLDEIRARVALAFGRNFLCRDIRFEVISTPRLGQGANWTISMQQVTPDALWEASEIVSDIQEAYFLMDKYSILSHAA
ncbi:hypothetical protein E0H22_05280 [Rhodopseudomonas boonkerdii]|uniref:hypothetical protein n=1 Tax=Rhodopseudomonas boonkerdii TaxID=475937 RepID=UPI001E508633|nr:hypothetical protein [Rhodopseudomonas boonkerdii]UGV25140.1 hypothetical protein E0H22_05280 [Rhodopseudomonas boonkerdii]